MRGYLPGTSPFPPGNPFAEGGAPTVVAPPAHPGAAQTAPINVPVQSASALPAGAWSGTPAPYNWNGLGTVPPEVMQVATAIASAVGDPPVPTEQLGQLWGYVWQMMTTSEGCGVSPSAVAQAVTTAAPQGPAAVAYALQQLMQGTRCAGVITNPLSPPAVTQPPAVVYPPGGGTGTVTAPPAASTVPWGWVIGGVGILAAAGIAAYVVTRKKKRHENPCACGNPSINPGVMTLTTPFRAVNPTTAEFDGVFVEFEETDVEEHENPTKRRKRRK